MILTLEDYKKAYKILETEWDNEVKPALDNIHDTLEMAKEILAPYKTIAVMNSVPIDPYHFFSTSNPMDIVVYYSKNPTCFHRFVQSTRNWTNILMLGNYSSDSTDFSDIHKGLLYWRGQVNSIKEGIRLFYRNGTKYLEQYVTKLINNQLAPKADKSAREFLDLFGMTKKLPKVQIKILVDEME